MYGVLPWCFVGVSVAAKRLVRAVLVLGLQLMPLIHLLIVHRLCVETIDMIDVSDRYDSSSV